MAGIDRHTRKPIERPAHIRQSIEVLLTTPKGTRVMRRELGLASLNEDGSVKSSLMASEVAGDVRETLARYEPRISVRDITPTFDGQQLSSIEVHYQDVESSERSSITISYCS